MRSSRSPRRGRGLLPKPRAHDPGSPVCARREQAQGVLAGFSMSSWYESLDSRE